MSWPEFLIDLAAFEWTFSEVFDGPGVEGGRGGVAPVLLDEAKVRAVPAERWPEARLAAVPCLRLMTVRFPVQNYYAEVRAEKAPSLPAPAETHLALVRRHYVVHTYPLTALEHRLLMPWSRGEPWGRRSRRSARSPGADLEGLAANLHAWFRRLAALGFFRAVELPA